MGKVQLARMRCKLHSPVCRASFVAACVFLVLSLLWFAICLAGLDKIPRCRYGENDCYYRAPNPVCDSTGAFCNSVWLINMRVEGSAADSMEQFALPIVAAICSMLPPIFTFIGTLFDHQLGSMELGKCFVVGACVLSVIGIWIVQTLTFDCRWWNQTTQEDCKEGFNMYVAGSLMNIISQIILLGFMIVFVEDVRDPEESRSLTEKDGEQDTPELPAGLSPTHSSNNAEDAVNVAL